MKVLHVCTHMNIGGIGQYVLSLCRAMKPDHADCIVASSGGSLESELEKIGVPHKYINIRTKFEFGPKVFAASADLEKIIREEKIDIVHAHTRVSQVASLIAAGRTKTHYVSTCHGFFKPRLFRRLIDTWGEKVVAISAPVKAHLEMDFHIDPKRVELIHNGVDMSRFLKTYSSEAMNRIKRSIGLKDGPVIGTIGRLSSIKGQRFLIEAMKYIDPKFGHAQCLIVGSGTEEAALRDLAKKTGLEDRVIFAGPVYDDAPLYLTCMDIFVLPSIKEGLGLALLEAMASGKPCVASDVGGISDIIKDGINGILVPPANASAIADSISKLLGDKDLNNRLGQSGKVSVKESFTLDFMARKMDKLYMGVINEKK